jgi:hypothetical protein
MPSERRLTHEAVPYCAGKIHRDAIKCKHCGEFLKKDQNGSSVVGPHGDESR